MFENKIRILVVDDMMPMRKVIAKTLKLFGYSDIIEACDGAKAWETLNGSEVPVDLIISDWNMPNSSGMDLLRRVRAENRFKQMPFILLTAESEDQQIAEAAQAGVSGYVTKPFRVASLKEQIEAAYHKHAALDAA